MERLDRGDPFPDSWRPEASAGALRTRGRHLRLAHGGRSWRLHSVSVDASPCDSFLVLYTRAISLFILLSCTMRCYLEPGLRVAELTLFRLLVTIVDLIAGYVVNSNAWAPP
jgi:hypothetical protein